jgi:ureidoglycolate lyase
MSGISKENYLNRIIPPDVKVKNIPLVKATNESLKDMGYLITSPDDVTVQNGKFDIVPWPTKGWRALDPNTGNEAGTTEGSMDIYWEEDRLYGKNHAIATDSNHYLLGFGNLPTQPASLSKSNIREPSEPSSVFIWYSDYHPDGGQLFFPTNGKPFISNLAPAVGDDITPDHFTAFYVSEGYGLYIYPGVWHNAVYIHPSHSPISLFGRQGRIHARISVDWVKEFNTLLRVPLTSADEGEGEGVRVRVH